MGFFTKKSVYWRDQIKGLAPLPPPSWEQALELFDMLADLRHITYGFAASGCQARTHLMCVEMVDKGYLPGKAWVFEGFEPLSVQLPDNMPMSPTVWCFHVAPTLDVDLGAPDGVRAMVFDPSMFDGPVLPEHWCDTMQGSPQRLHLARLGESAPGQRGDYLPYSNRNRNDAVAFTTARTTSIAMEGMEEFRPHIKTPVRRVFSCGRRPLARGTTWCTYQPPRHHPKPANSRRL